MTRPGELLRSGARGPASAALVLATGDGLAGWPAVDDVPGHLGAAERLWARGRPARTRVHLRRVLELGPRTPQEWSRFTRVARFTTWSGEDGRFASVLAAGVAMEGVEAQDLVPTALAFLRADGTWRALEDRVRGGGTAWPRSALLEALLRRTLVADPDAEPVLVGVRRALLGEARGSGDLLSLACAVAIQCFRNEYLWPVTPGEASRVEALARVWPRLGGYGLAQLGAYRALGGLSDATALLGRDWPDPVARLLRVQVAEPREEREIAARLSSAGQPTSAMSRRVRRQYEENPYPRWIDVDREEPTPLAVNLAAWFPHLEVPAFLSGKPRVLIAGTGTGRHAILRARRFREASFLAIDLSRASLAYGARRARELGVTNVDFQHADLLELPGDRASFHVIECVGVLNCVADPLSAWRTLLRHLVPGGLFLVALYSHHARREIRDVWRSLGRHPRDLTVSEMRAARQRILALPAGHRPETIVRSADFYSLGGCRDLLFHVEEKQFTLCGPGPRAIDGMIRELGLELVGFELAQPFVGRMHDARFPEDPCRTSLARWDVLETENPWIFAGMYQIWTRRPARG